MKIYTKGGDQGETSLLGGGRVLKSHPRVAAYGTLDEANSALGLALSFLQAGQSPVQVRLTRIQKELFQIGSELATQTQTKNPCLLIGMEEILLLEKEIDEMEGTLAPLQNFILPGGANAGAATHVARTIVRRAERECVELSRAEIVRPETIQYLNRLSDYLFVMGRFINHELNQPETKWLPPKA